jgi:FKBP-type peptidyl-prolyl cis-trans isomerase FkpA
MKNALVFTILIATFTTFTSCDTDYKAQDDALIQQYIKDNNLTAIAAQDGLYYTMDVAGTGVQPSGVYSTVTIDYTGKFLDGGIFDTSTGRGPYVNQLTGVIKGWQYGIPLFRAGGRGKLLIPSHLAYGTSGQGSIPANTPLVFDIELITVQN